MIVLQLMLCAYFFLLMGIKINPQSVQCYSMLPRPLFFLGIKLYISLVMLSFLFLMKVNSKKKSLSRKWLYD